MQIELTIKNYRCFSDENFARIVIRRGSTAFVGVNNAGKSTLLNFFFEFRSIFGLLSSPSGNCISALRGQPQVFSPPPMASDIESVFNNSSERPIVIRMMVLHHEGVSVTPPVSTDLTLTIPRGSNTFVASIVGVDKVLLSGQVGFVNSILASGETQIANLHVLFKACAFLADTYYPGPKYCQ